ncbi:MAG: hypothetical protein ACOX5G_00010 [Kiritimatiellia bacterium]
MARISWLPERRFVPLEHETLVFEFYDRGWRFEKQENIAGKHLAQSEALLDRVERGVYGVEHT